MTAKLSSKQTKLSSIHTVTFQEDQVKQYAQKHIILYKKIIRKWLLGMLPKQLKSEVKIFCGQFSFHQKNMSSATVLHKLYTTFALSHYEWFISHSKYLTYYWILAIKHFVIFNCCHSVTEFVLIQRLLHCELLETLDFSHEVNGAFSTVLSILFWSSCVRKTTTFLIQVLSTQHLTFYFTVS